MNTYHINSVKHYRNAVVYRLFAYGDEHYYIGSSSNFKQRFKEHSNSGSTGSSKRVIAWLSKIGKEKLEYEFLEEYSDISLDDLREEEDSYLRKHISDTYCLNENLCISENTSKKKWIHTGTVECSWCKTSYGKGYISKHRHKCPERPDGYTGPKRGRPSIIK